MRNSSTDPPPQDSRPSDVERVLQDDEVIANMLIVLHPALARALRVGLAALVDGRGELDDATRERLRRFRTELDVALAVVSEREP